MDALYLEDLEVGRAFESDSCEMGVEEIVDFARRFDPQPFHLSDEGAAGSVFGGQAASGWHVAAITMRLLVLGGAPIAGGLIGAGSEVTWLRPTRPGDVLRVFSVVEEVRPSRSKPRQGLVVLRSETRNAAGDVLQVMTSTLVVPRRPVPVGPS